jgi:hypothetical protein
LILVDDEDYEALNAFTWYLTRRGYATRKKRVGEVAPSTHITMHRQIMGVQEVSEPHVDHINGDITDNRRQNLRLVTHAENMQNRKNPPNKSGYRGVHWNPLVNAFYVSITVNGVKHSAGRFENIEDAARAYNELALKHLGEIARLNEI